MKMSISPKNERRGGGIFLYIILSLFIFSLIFVWVNIKVRPFIISVAKGYAINYVSNELNDIINEELTKDTYSFVHLIEDGEGKIAAATMNSGDVNLFVTRVSIGLRDKIADMDEIQSNIPIGNFIPYPFFAGLGPKVPVKFLILANTSVSAEETFTEKGINQTLHTISIKVVFDVGIYIPTMHSGVTVESDVPLSKTLIVGSVPDSYTNVEGLEGSAQEAVLEVD